MKYVAQLSILIALLIPKALKAKEIIALSNGEWKPFLGEKLPHGGVASHIITEAFSLVGIKVHYKWYKDAWKRAYIDAFNAKEVKIGSASMKLSGSCVWSRKPEREKQMYYSEPVIPGEFNVFVYLKDSEFDWKDIKDLKGRRVGATIGYFYGSDIEKAAKDKIFIMERIAYEPNNLKRLLTGKIDLFLVNRKIAIDLIKTNLTAAEGKKLKIHPKPASRGLSQHLILTRKVSENQKLLQKFNEGLKKLKESGKFDQYHKDADGGKYDS